MATLPAPADRAELTTMAPLSLPPAPSRRRKVLTGVAIALVAALTVGAGMVWAALDAHRSTLPGTTSSPATAQSLRDVRRAAVDQVLNQLNAALASGDEKAYVATVDPQASTTFRDHERSVFQGLRTLSTVASFEYTWANERVYVPPTGQPSPNAFTAYVELNYRFNGYDRTPVVDAVGMSFRQRNDRWYISSDSDVDDRLPLGGRFEPWMTGPVSIAQRGRALVIGDPAHRAQNERLARQLDTALKPVAEVWPVTSWNGRVVAYASTQPAFVSSWFGTHAATSRKIDPSADATFEAKVRVLPAESVTAESDPFTPAAPRLVVTPYLLGRDDAYSRAVLRHELTHVALALEGQRRPPAWLVEGAAEYTGFRAIKGGRVDGVESLAQRGLRKDTWAQLRKGTWQPSLVAKDDDFYSGSELAVDNAYTTAWFTCLYIANHYGETTLRKLYEAAARESEALRQDQVETQMLTNVLHTNRASLLAATVKYARGLRTHFV